jgi:PEP-CTERM motif
MRRKIQAAVVFALFLCFAGAARPDTIVTLDLNASFGTEQSGPAQHQDSVFFPASGPVPVLYVTGEFAWDETTSTIDSFNIGFLGPLGATYQLSPQDIGTFTPSGGCLDCTVPGAGWWEFALVNDTAGISLSTLLGSNAPFYTGESLTLCPIMNTEYGGVSVPFLYACPSTTGGYFEDFAFPTGVVYELPNGQSSGVLTVASVISTPEPATLWLLALGIVAIVSWKSRGYPIQKYRSDA